MESPIIPSFHHSILLNSAPIERACFWMATHSFSPEPPLLENHSTDIAIIGAGFTGLWAALFLRDLDPNVRISIVEQGIAGYGGSGRNAGILGETIDHSHSLAVAHFGWDEARRLALLGKENVEEMISYFAEQSIDCEFERTGRLFVALTESQLAEAHQMMGVAEKLGIEGNRFLNAAEIRQELNSPLYLGGIFAGGGGILNPFKLAQGLKNLTLNKNIRVFEQTRILEMRDGILTGEQAQVKAGKIILATDAYTHHLYPRLLKRFIPLYDYIIVSDPLTPEQQQKIGWHNRQGVTDGRTFFNYYRLTKDNRVVWGTSEAKYYPPNRVGPEFDHSQNHYDELRISFHKHFPALNDLNFSYAWGGAIASTTRLTPFFGTAENGHLFYGLGYTGHGVGSTRIAGKILAHLALNRHSKLLDLKLVKDSPFPFPPEPIRNWAVQSVTNALRKTDQGESPSLLLRILDRLGIGFSS